jgi:hypothetical protein
MLFNMKILCSRKNNTAFSIVLFIVCFLSVRPVAYAAENQAVIDKVIRVSPVIVHLNLTPDHTTTYSDFDTTAEDGGYILTDKNTNSLLSWVSLDHEEWTITPKSKQKVNLTIKTPQRISIGGYYGLLFFQPIVPQTNNQTVVSARVGVLMLGDIGIGAQSSRPGEISSFELPYLSQDASMPLLLRVKNTSLNFFTAKPIIRIKPLIGESYTQFLEEKIIFPAKIRRWENVIRLEHVGIGIYTITMQVSTGNGKSIQTERMLIIFPWVPVLVTLLMCIIILWSVRNIQRIKKAVTILVSRNEKE